MLARFAIADQFLRTRIEVLLCAADAFPEPGRCRLVQNLDAAAGTFGDVDLVKPWVFVPTTGSNYPHLPRR